MSNYLRGIDVSHYQPHIDWAKVAGAGFSFAFCKATEGVASRDELFGSYWRQMRAAGIVRGAYHFFLPTDNAADEAAHFCDVLDRIGGGLRADDLPPVCDVERAGDMSIAELSASVHAWCDAVRTHFGRTPMLYLSKGFGGLDDSFGDFPLWVARYANVPDPGVPHGWSDWAFWQTADHGEVPGVSGTNVDINVFHRETLADLQAWVAEH